MAESGPVESSNLETVYENDLAVLAMPLSPHPHQNCKISVGNKNRKRELWFEMCMKKDTH